MKITYYKIYCLDKEIKEVYIGSTKHIKQRIYDHKSECKLNGTQVVYMFINVNGGFDNWAFEILDEIKVESKVEKLKIEREFIKKYPLNLNDNIPGRSKKEYVKDNPEKRSLIGKKYYYSHPEKIKEKYQRRKKRFFECECGSITKIAEKARHFRTKKHINYIELNK